MYQDKNKDKDKDKASITEKTFRNLNFFRCIALPWIIDSKADCNKVKWIPFLKRENVGYGREEVH